MQNKRKRILSIKLDLLCDNGRYKNVEILNRYWRAHKNITQSAIRYTYLNLIYIYNWPSNDKFLGFVIYISHYNNIIILFTFYCIILNHSR